MPNFCEYLWSSFMKLNHREEENEIADCPLPLDSFWERLSSVRSVFEGEWVRGWTHTERVLWLGNMSIPLLPPRTTNPTRLHCHELLISLDPRRLDSISAGQLVRVREFDPRYRQQQRPGDRHHFDVCLPPPLPRKPPHLCSAQSSR